MAVSRMMYWQTTHIWWLLLNSIYMIFGWWSFWLNLHKASFILSFSKPNHFFKTLKYFKGQDNPQVKTTTYLQGM
jgi:hypothetical protein